MALVLVLSLVALLGIIAFNHARVVHLEITQVARQVEVARARAAAESIFALAVLDLQSGNASAWPLDGTVRRIEFDGHRVAIAVRDITGLVDINAAGAGLVEALLELAGVNSDERERLTAAILDYRDADDLTRLRGAEADAYLSAGLEWTPRNGPFASVEELGHVMGMTPELFAFVAPFVTVHSGQATVNLSFAPPLLLSALTGRPVADGRATATGAASTGSGSGTYRIYVEASANALSRASVESDVRIARDRDGYFRLTRVQPMRTAFPAPGEDRG